MNLNAVKNRIENAEKKGSISRKEYTDLVNAIYDEDTKASKELGVETPSLLNRLSKITIDEELKD